MILLMILAGRTNFTPSHANAWLGPPELGERAEKLRLDAVSNSETPMSTDMLGHL